MKIELEGTISPEITLKDIEVVEKKMNVKFPEEYVQFMLEQNGGYPKICEFEFTSENIPDVVNHFYSIGNMSLNLQEVYKILDGVIPEEYISIGDDPVGNDFLMRVKGENIGEIYFRFHDVDPEEEDPMHFLANSLNEFLKMLK